MVKKQGIGGYAAPIYPRRSHLLGAHPHQYPPAGAAAAAQSRQTPSGASSVGPRGRSNPGDRVSLERVVGNTVTRSALFAASTTGEVLYAAGCVAVVYAPRANRQSRLLRAPRAIACVAFSASGRTVAAGEQGGPGGAGMASVLVWDAATGQLAATLVGAHRAGVACVAFSPNGKFIVSVGFHADGFVKVWDWRSGQAIAAAKTGAHVHSVSFHEDGIFFCTAGQRHLKFWSLTATPAQQAPPGLAAPEAMQIEGRNAAVGERKDETFVEVACGKGSGRGCVYAVSHSGTLFLFSASRVMEKWVDLRSRVFGVSTSERYVCVACTDGNVRVFAAQSLQYVVSLPKPFPVAVDLCPTPNGIAPRLLAQPQPAAASSSPDQPAPAIPAPPAMLPDVIAVRVVAPPEGSTATRVACCYSDRTINIWSVDAIPGGGSAPKVVKYRSLLAHGACIWDVAAAPATTPPVTLPAGPATAASVMSSLGGSTASSASVPPSPQTQRQVQVVMATCSSDGSVRVWGIDGTTSGKELLHSIQACAGAPVKAPHDFDARDFACSPSPVDGGVRSVCFRPDGAHLATGDRQGNLRVYDCATWRCITSRAAHAAEILCIDYSKPASQDDQVLLATASRDRLIHIFDAGRGRGARSEYPLLTTVDDQTSPITAVRFALGFSRIISCSTDRSITFRATELEPRPTTTRLTSGGAPVCLGAPAKYDLFSLAVDPTEKFLMAGQDKKLALLSLSTGRITRTYKAEDAVVKLDIDPAGLNAVASGSEKNALRLYDCFTGSVTARFEGHSDTVTAVKFSHDGRRVFSTSEDGCIFIWSLDKESQVAMQLRMCENNELNKPSAAAAAAAKLETPRQPQSASKSRLTVDMERKDPESPCAKFSDTGLPTWAGGHDREKKPLEGGNPSAKGAWANRVLMFRPLSESDDETGEGDEEDDIVDGEQPQGLRQHLSVGDLVDDSDDEQEDQATEEEGEVLEEDKPEEQAIEGAVEEQPQTRQFEVKQEALMPDQQDVEREPEAPPELQEQQDVPAPGVGALPPVPQIQIVPEPPIDYERKSISAEHASLEAQVAAMLSASASKYVVDPYGKDQAGRVVPVEIPAELQLPQQQLPPQQQQQQQQAEEVQGSLGPVATHLPLFEKLHCAMEDVFDVLKDSAGTPREAEMKMMLLDVVQQIKLHIGDVDEPPPPVPTPQQQQQQLRSQSQSPTARGATVAPQNVMLSSEDLERIMLESMQRLADNVQAPHCE
eukprot:m51a1_g11766 hypothetical protein (1243) ;mRNA; r:231681-236319